MKNIQAYDIKYDTDNDTALAAALPQRLTFLVDEDFEPATELADLISDATGFCVFGCSFESLNLDR